jgi:flagellar biogenesis protein FliO
MQNNLELKIVSDGLLLRIIPQQLIGVKEKIFIIHNVKSLLVVAMPVNLLSWFLIK